MTQPQNLSHPRALGAVGLTLRAEGLAIAAAAVLGFSQSGGSWILFAALILAPDLMMLGYLAGNRVGAFCYNLGHSYLGPVALGGLGLWWQMPLAFELALIWAAHIGLDRSIGYGLKYDVGFKQTHLARV